MRVTNTDSRTVKTYWLAIADGEVRDQPYTRSGRRYQVQRVTVVKQDGNVHSVELHGAVLKKDGTAGLNGANERMFRESEWPGWLRSMVGGLA